MMGKGLVLATALLFATCSDALVPQHSPRATRREVMTSSGAWVVAAATLFGGISAFPGVALADEDNQVLTDEQMAARVARKMELLKGKKSGGTSSGLDDTPAAASAIRSDVNPDAAVNLRSRSVAENAKVALAKQSEMKGRDKLQKRDDLCEMLGRGC